MMNSTDDACEIEEKTDEEKIQQFMSKYGIFVWPLILFGVFSFGQDMGFWFSGSESSSNSRISASSATFGTDQSGFVTLEGDISALASVDREFYAVPYQSGQSRLEVRFQSGIMQWYLIDYPKQSIRDVIEPFGSETLKCQGFFGSSSIYWGVCTATAPHVLKLKSGTHFIDYTLQPGELVAYTSDGSNRNIYHLKSK